MGLHQRDLGVIHQLADVSQRGRELDRGGVLFVVRPAFLLDYVESYGNQVVELDQTGDEKSTKAFNWVVWDLIAESYDQVSLATVALHDGDKHGHLVTPSLSAHQSTNERAGHVETDGGLSLEALSGGLGGVSYDVGLEAREGVCLNPAGEDLHREPLVVLLLLRKDGEALDHVARPEALQQRQHALRVHQQGAEQRGGGGVHLCRLDIKHIKY